MTDVGYVIPLDLIIEILIRLPAKSVLRFRSVSKLWCSIISSQQFIDAFMTLSLSRPRLALILNNCDDDRSMFFFSAHQSCSFMSSSSLLITEKNTLTMPEFTDCGPFDLICNNSVRGFICCRLGNWFVVCNPSTGQVIRLADMNYINYYYCRMYLGYDPNNDQYKVLRLRSPTSVFGSCIEYSVLTLGGGQGPSHIWRPIKTIKTNTPNYYRAQNGVYIDGVVYYEDKNRGGETVVTSFDVGSEQLSLITPPEYFRGYDENYLTDYLGKLAVYCERDNEFIGFEFNGFMLWVLDDVKNQVWSDKLHVVPSLSMRSLSFSFAGITEAGEIVYVPRRYLEPFELLFYDVEKKTERRVRVQGRLSDVKCYNKPTHRKMTWASLLCPYVDNITYFSGN